MSTCTTKLVILALQIIYFLPILGAPFLKFLFGCMISFMCVLSLVGSVVFFYLLPLYASLCVFCYSPTILFLVSLIMFSWVYVVNIFIVRGSGVMDIIIIIIGVFTTNIASRSCENRPFASLKLTLISWRS